MYGWHAWFPGQPSFVLHVLIARPRLSWAWMWAFLETAAVSSVVSSVDVLEEASTLAVAANVLLLHMAKHKG